MLLPVDVYKSLYYTGNLEKILISFTLSCALLIRWNGGPLSWSLSRVVLSSTSPWPWTSPAPTATQPIRPHSTTGGGTSVAESVR